jgi:hypothetical protein
MDYTLKESDWRKVREKLPGWQENYMDRLCKEYIVLLSQDKSFADRFWALEKRIQKDKRCIGVTCEMRRSVMLQNLLELLDEKVIRIEDLDDFSDELKAWVKMVIRA